MASDIMYVYRRDVREVKAATLCYRLQTTANILQLIYNINFEICNSTSFPGNHF